MFIGGRIPDDVVAALGVIGKPTIIIGHGMGGLVALSTAIETRHPLSSIGNQ